jgi:arylsulfatase A-like enzyme
VLEDGTTDCCRLVAPAGETALTMALNCTVLPMFTCYENEKNKIVQTSATADPGSCCEACAQDRAEACVAWTHTKKINKDGRTKYKCNLYSTIGKTKETHDGCSSGVMPGGKPAPLPPPAPPQPRNGRPNILFLIVESTDGRTWTPGYSNDAIKLPNLRALQKGGLNFQRHFSNSPVCCPSRSAFWSGRHVSNLEHTHPGYPGVEVPGAINNYEGLPNGYDKRIDQVLQNTTNYAVKVSGKTDWTTGGHSENVHLDAWTMYAAWPYNISRDGGWNEENGCVDEGRVTPGGGPRYPEDINASNFGADWSTLKETTEWITEASKNKDVPWFAFQGANIVHPSYRTNKYWYDQIDQDSVTVPAWQPLDQMHPCDFQSSMLKGCMPPPGTKIDGNGHDFYTDAHRKWIRSIYYAMIAEWDAMVGAYVDTVKKAGVWDNTVTIISSDHGDMQMEKQQFYKMVPYDASASVPMVIYDGRPGRQNPKAGPEIMRPTQLIDIFPTILTYAKVDVAQWPTLDGSSLTPLMAVDGDAEAAAVDPRPDFTVSQFHGDNVSVSCASVSPLSIASWLTNNGCFSCLQIAMSWFLVVKQGVTLPGKSGTSAASTSTFKLILWGTGKEVPSLLFDLVADPMEDTNLIADAAGAAKYAQIVDAMEQNLQSVVDYKKMAMKVATYGKLAMADWVKNEGANWTQEIHKKGLRWTPSWDADSDASFAALRDFCPRPPGAVKRP